MPIPVVQIRDGARIHAFVHDDVFAADVITTNRMLLSFLFALHVEYLDVEHFITFFGEYEDVVLDVVNKDINNHTPARMQARLLRQVLED